jgi:hypothetical protein
VGKDSGVSGKARLIPLPFYCLLVKYRMKLPLVDHEGKRVLFAGPGTGYRMLAES